MLQTKKIHRSTAAFAAAIAASLLLPALWAALPIAFFSVSFVAVRGGRKRLKFITAMTLPLAFGLWLVHGGVFFSLVRGEQVAANSGAFFLWLRIFAIVAAGQAWLSCVSTEDVIRCIFASNVSAKFGFLLASPLLLTEQIKQRLAQIEEAQLARGVNIHGSFAERVKSLCALLLPLILGLLGDLPSRSAALDMKGFGLAKKRTSLHASRGGAELPPLPDAEQAVEVCSAAVASPSGDAEILNIPRFHLNRGGWALIAGGSGSGKSSLALLLCGAVPEHMPARVTGEIRVFGAEPVSALALSPYVQYVQQNPLLTLSGCTFTVREEIAFGLENIAADPADIEERVAEALALTEIEFLSERNPRELSGGELQKCAIACAVAMRPKLLILDEAFSRIHVKDRARIIKNLERWSERCSCAVVLLEQRQDLPVPESTQRWSLERGVLSCGEGHSAVCEWPVYSAGCGDAPVLELKNITFSWAEEGDELLHGISASVRRGERIALTGANGAGKSTLIRLAAGLLSPRSGTVTLNGTDVGTMKPSVRAPKIAFLFQDSERQIFHSTVREEVAFALRGLNMSAEEKDARVARALEAFSLTGKEEAHPLDLSSSERRMTGVASIAVTDFELLLLDEPTRDMDEEHQLIFERWLASQKSAVLAISHDPDFTERAFHRKWLLADGALHEVNE